MEQFNAFIYIYILHIFWKKSIKVFIVSFIDKFIKLLAKSFSSIYWMNLYEIKKKTKFADL
jgi:hypothetical protein